MAIFSLDYTVNDERSMKVISRSHDIERDCVIPKMTRYQQVAKNGIFTNASWPIARWTDGETYRGLLYADSLHILTTTPEHHEPPNGLNRYDPLMLKVLRRCGHGTMAMMVPREDPVLLDKYRHRQRIVTDGVNTHVFPFADDMALNPPKPLYIPFDESVIVLDSPDIRVLSDLHYGHTSAVADLLSELCPSASVYTRLARLGLNPETIYDLKTSKDYFHPPGRFDNILASVLIDQLSYFLTSYKSLYLTMIVYKNSLPTSGRYYVTLILRHQSPGYSYSSPLYSKTYNKMFGARKMEPYRSRWRRRLPSTQLGEESDCIWYYSGGHRKCPVCINPDLDFYRDEPFAGLDVPLLLSSATHDHFNTAFIRACLAAAIRLFDDAFSPYSWFGTNHTHALSAQLLGPKDFQVMKSAMLDLPCSVVYG